MVVSNKFKKTKKQNILTEIRTRNWSGLTLRHFENCKTGGQTNSN